MATPYVSLALVKQALRIPATNTAEDELVQQKIDAAQLAIDNQAGQSFGRTETATAQTIDPRYRLISTGGGSYRLLVPNIADTAGLAVTADGNAVTATAWPSSAIQNGQPITSLRLAYGGWLSADLLMITAIWGWPAVPADIREACLMQATRYYRRRDSPEGVAGSAEWGLVRVPYLDPDVRAIVSNYKMPGIA